MATPLTDSINALTTYANEVTGQSDTTLSDAVHTLASGYGGGSDTEKEQLISALARTAVRIDLPSITTLGYMAFSNNNELKYVKMENLETLRGTYVFNSCPNIEEAYFPKLKETTSMFLASNKLKNLALPSANGLANTCIIGTELEGIDIGGESGNISPGNFKNSAKLSTIILRRDSVIGLSRLNEIEVTSFGASGTGGILYVPQNLISNYQSSNNWSTLLSYPNNQILPIEGSIYETQYADGTPIEQKGA